MKLFNYKVKDIYGNAYEFEGTHHLKKTEMKFKSRKLVDVATEFTWFYYGNIKVAEIKVASIYRDFYKYITPDESYL